MKKFLSIDWDYFIDASAFERSTMFPDGGNEDLDICTQNLVWKFRYEDNPTMGKINLIKEYNSMVSILLKFLTENSRNYANQKFKVLVGRAISHKYIYNFILDRTNSDEEFEVYNVDFHHDMYYYHDSTNPVNCGNWVRELLKVRPNMKYYWIKREDSDTTLLGGDEIPESSILPFDRLKELDFDYVYICRSDIWSPPHLDSKFDFISRMCSAYVRTETMDSLNDFSREHTYH